MKFSIKDFFSKEKMRFSIKGFFSKEIYKRNP